MSDPADMNLKDLAAAIRRRKVSSVEVTKALLARIDKWQPDAQRVRARRGRGCAEIRQGRGPRARRRQGERARCTACRSPTRTCTTPRASSPNAARRSAKALSRPRPRPRWSGWKPPARSASAPSTWSSSPTGRPATTSIPATSAIRGARTRITGGSSSGSGSAVAARLVPAALGSDTGGSIRMPAHFCGVTGFKPTNNRVSRANAMPLSFTLDTVGPLAQTAEDCAIILSLIAGPDPLDPTTAQAPKWDGNAMKRPAKGRTIGIPKSFYVDDLEPDVAKALRRARSRPSRSSASRSCRSTCPTRCWFRRPP